MYIYSLNKYNNTHNPCSNDTMDIKQQTLECIDDCIGYHDLNNIIEDITPTLLAFRALLTDPNATTDTTVAALQEYINDTFRQFDTYNSTHQCRQCGAIERCGLWSIRAHSGHEGAIDGAIEVCKDCYDHSDSDPHWIK